MSKLFKSPGNQAPVDVCRRGSGSTGEKTGRSLCVLWGGATGSVRDRVTFASSARGRTGIPCSVAWGIPGNLAPSGEKFWLRGGPPATRRAGKTAPDVGAATSSGSGRRLLCATCGHRITSEGERISVLGSHEHRFFNPAGFLFHIGCFRNAPGCLTAGQPTTEFTWFPGFAWRHALCGGCSQHLGWCFTSAEASAFFGLVLNRLIEAEDGQA